VQALSQQTPSTHCPDSHSVPAPQVVPFFLATGPPPHCLTAAPPTITVVHGLPGAQSASLAQVLLQAPFAQRYGEQSSSCASRHWPSPSQLRALASIVSPAQVASPQTAVLAGNLAHEPKPSQTPVVPQVVRFSAGQEAGSGRPAAMNSQRPTAPVWLQATHGPLQATLQQTLSAQNPDTHSVPAAQVAPFIFLPQLLPTHG
jgi:hypothetical protein